MEKLQTMANLKNNPPTSPPPHHPTSPPPHHPTSPPPHHPTSPPPHHPTSPPPHLPITPPFSLELAQDLLTTYGSPLYVYQGLHLRQTIERITQAFPYPQTKFRFASVTNGNIALLQIFQSAGWGLHANTPGDIYLGLLAGFKGRDIVYSGSNLNAVEMEQVLDWGVTTLNLDSLSQLELCGDLFRAKTLKRKEENDLRVGLRVNLPEITGDSRIGVRVEEFGDADSH